MDERRKTTDYPKEETAGRLDLQLLELLEFVFELERAASRLDRLEASIHYTPAQGRRLGR